VSCGDAESAFDVDDHDENSLDIGCLLGHETRWDGSCMHV